MNAAPHLPRLQPSILYQLGKKRRISKSKNVFPLLDTIEPIHPKIIKFVAANPGHPTPHQS